MEFEKTDDDRFVRDKRSTAILNKDKNGYQQFLIERERAYTQQQLAKEVDHLRSEFSEIKQLLQQLINGRTHGTPDS